MNHTHAVVADNITITYGSQVALKGVSVAIPAGVLCAVIGPNGAGKSTFLKAVLGLITPQTGTVQVCGISASKAYTHIAYVPQRVAIDWHFPITVFDLVLMGRYKGGLFGGRYTVQDYAIVNDALVAVGMILYAQKLIGELSGGQQQRAFIARALVQQRQLIILDEPFNGVDETTEQVCIALLKKLQKQGVTILVVHHDLTAVKNYADWLVVLKTTLTYAGPLHASTTDLHHLVHDRVPKQSIVRESV